MKIFNLICNRLPTADRHVYTVGWVNSTHWITPVQNLCIFRDKCFLVRKEGEDFFTSANRTETDQRSSNQGSMDFAIFSRCLRKIRRTSVRCDDEHCSFANGFDLNLIR